MTRIVVRVVAFVLALGTSEPALAQAPAKKPNILVIWGDDIGIHNISDWQDIDSYYAGAAEALSMRCGGQGVVIFLGMAKPVRVPQIGPARAY